MVDLLGYERAGRDHPVAEGLDYVATWNSAFLPSRELDSSLQQALVRIGKKPSKL